MAAPKVLTPHSAVARLYDLEARIYALQLEYEAAAKELIDAGEGHYGDPTGRAAVAIIPTKFATTFNLYAPDALKAFLATRQAKKATPVLLKEFRAMREERAEQLAGDHYRTLFDRQVVFSPATAFADMAPRILTPAKARDLLLLCQVVKKPGKAHVKLSDKPKREGAPDAEDAED